MVATNTVSNWRRLRDVALQYANQEEGRVQKLIQRSQTCMDILVPRVGVEHATNNKDKDEKKDTNAQQEDDDEEDDIDWEDGWEAKAAAEEAQHMNKRPSFGLGAGLGGLFRRTGASPCLGRPHMDQPVPLVDTTVVRRYRLLRQRPLMLECRRQIDCKRSKKKSSAPWRNGNCK